MDNAPELEENTPTLHPTPPRGGGEQRKHTELIVDALRMALSEPVEHRLFRAGKLAGLFPSRTGAAADAALFAIREGLFEIARTETKGRLVTEWVRPMPRGVAYLHDHDSPKAVLQDLRAAIGATQAGVPVWMAEAKAEIVAVSERFEKRAGELISHLEELTKRVEAALRRAELGSPTLPGNSSQVVPWGLEALAYLDRRLHTGIPGDCPLGELFHAIGEKAPAVTLREFHDGLRRLHDLRAIKLTVGNESDPEFAMQVGAEFCSFAAR